MKDNNAIPKWLLNIKHLDLTLSGMITLSIFNEEIIRHADNAISKMGHKKLNNVFGYFFAICSTKMSQLGFEYNWDAAADLKKHYPDVDEEDNKLNKDMIIDPEKPIHQNPKNGASGSRHTRRCSAQREQLEKEPYIYGGGYIYFPKGYTREQKLTWYNNFKEKHPSFILKKRTLRPETTESVEQAWRRYSNYARSDSGKNILEKIGIPPNFNPFISRLDEERRNCGLSNDEPEKIKHCLGLENNAKTRLELNQCHQDHSTTNNLEKNK